MTQGRPGIFTVTKFETERLLGEKAAHPETIDALSDFIIRVTTKLLSRWKPDTKCVVCDELVTPETTRKTTCCPICEICAPDSDGLDLCAKVLEAAAVGKR